MQLELVSRKGQGTQTIANMHRHSNKKQFESDGCWQAAAEQPLSGKTLPDKFARAKAGWEGMEPGITY